MFSRVLNCLLCSLLSLCGCCCALAAGPEPPENADQRDAPPPPPDPEQSRFLQRLLAVWPDLSPDQRWNYWRELDERQRQCLTQVLSQDERQRIKQRFVIDPRLAELLEGRPPRRLSVEERKLLRQQVTEVHIEVRAAPRQVVRCSDPADCLRQQAGARQRRPAGAQILPPRMTPAQAELQGQPREVPAPVEGEERPRAVPVAQP